MIFYSRYKQFHRGSLPILIAIFVMVLILIATIATAATMVGDRTGTGAGMGESDNGNICGSIPEPYNEIFTKAGDKWKVKPAFIAAIFYAGEHGNSWPSASGPWASSSKGAQGPFQFMPSTWDSNKQDGNGDGQMDIQNLWDASFGAAKLLANTGAGGNTTDENTLTEVAAKYNGGNKPPAFAYEVYAKNVLEAFNKFQCSTASGKCSTLIIEQAKKYAGIPYSQASHCGPNTFGPTGVWAVDCSGFISRVYRDLGLFQKGACVSTATIPNFSDLEEISASQVQTGDLVLSCCPGHVVIYVSGNVTKKFNTWQSGGETNGLVRETLRDARDGQRYFRAKKCN